ncbi:MAG TPA: hypothetical protein VMZ71_06565, partial [Gemmataceae bacterium]|nr:hypothetical protein [Gemmataceae bacterium]
MALQPRLAPAEDAPEWVRGVTRMTFTGDIAAAGPVGAQVAHTNLVWPYFPLRKDGGGLSNGDAEKMRAMMAAARKNKVRVGLGLPPFPSVAHVEKHPDWRAHPDDAGSVMKRKPVENDLGTRLGCNLGPWGDYLVELCGELVEDFGIDAFSFDGNYHPPVCYCPACKAAYRAEKQRDIPAKVNLDDIAYRDYLVWRGDKLIEHYCKLR